MKNRASVLVAVGTALILISMGTALTVNLFAAWEGENAAEVAAQIRQILPSGNAGVEGAYTDPKMPVLQFEGTDYVCLLEIPALDRCLPVRNDWNGENLSGGPCRFWGSAYDGTLILGGSSQTGQFDFCSQLDIDDRITVTDMEGTVFSYRVERIDRAKTAAYERLSDPSYSLILFVEEAFSTGYIIVRCNPAV